LRGEETSAIDISCADLENDRLYEEGSLPCMTIR